MPPKDPHLNFHPQSTHQSTNQAHPRQQHQQLTQKKIIDYSQQMKDKDAKQHKINENNVQEQLNQLMLKYASQPQQERSQGVGSNKVQREQQKLEDQANKKPVKIQSQSKLLYFINLGNQKDNSQKYGKKHDVELRMSCFGLTHDTEAEDYENLKHYIQHQLYEEHDNPLSIVHQKSDNLLQDNYQPQVSKSPVPMIYSNMASTPTSMQELKSSQQQAMQILNHYNQQYNNRNQQLPVQMNFKSHNLPIDNLSLLKEQKKSISTSDSTNGPFTNTTGTNLHKKNQQIRSNEGHKKSHSLYNKKIVEIISGLQQSLGVIANNVQTSFSNEDMLLKQDKQNALLLSAMLAQKLALMTESLKNNGNVNMAAKDKGSQKRKSIKINSTLSGRGSLNVGKKNSGASKTIEESLNDNKKTGNHSNRMSIDIQQQVKGNSNRTAHQRTRSDVQYSRKEVIGLNNNHQKVIQINQAKQSAGISQSNRQVDPNVFKNQNRIKQNFIDEVALSNYNSNPYPQSAKSFNRLNQPTSQDTQAYPVSSHNSKIYNGAENISKNKNVLQQNEDIAYNYKSTLSNAQNSGQSSIVVQNSIENRRLSSQQNNYKHGTQKSSKERLSEAAYLSQVNKKSAYLFHNPNSIQQSGKNKLKSNASSPSLHNNSHYYLPTKKISHNSSQSNTIFDFGQYQNQLSTITTNNVQAVNQKKKNLISLKKEVPINVPSTHKRSTSDGSSLTKMFHFKQQMLINKIYHQSQNTTGVVNTTQVKKHKLSTKRQTQQLGTSSQAKPKAQVASCFSSKRISNEDQENIKMNANYRSPRAFNNPQNQNIVQNPDVKKSQNIKIFLQQFKDRTNQFTNTDEVQIQQKKMLIQQQQSKKKPSSSKYSITNDERNNLEVQPKKSLDNIHINQDQMKRQSQQVQKASQIIQRHKRARSDVYQPIQQKVYQQQSQHISPRQQQVFSLNFNQDQDLNKKIEKKQIDNGFPISQNQPVNFIYSARASPCNVQNTYYNFEDSQQQTGTVSKTILPSARSEQSTKQKKNTMSNQTTQRKDCVNMQNNRGNENTNLKVTYNGTNNDQKMHNIQNSNVQPKNTNKFAHKLYGDNNPLKQQRPEGLALLNSNEDENEVVDLNQNCENKKYIVSGSDLKKLPAYSHNHSPKMKLIPTPKLAQPGISHFLFNEDHHDHLPSNFLIAPQQNLEQEDSIGKEFDGHHFKTFESNLTTHTMNNLTPRSRGKHKLTKQIKISFNKLKEPIKTTSEFYRIGKMLGKGAFGRVNLAIHKLCNQLIAVKSINKQFLSEDENSKKKVMQEVLILQKTRHDNIVRLYDSFETNKHIVFVMELCSGGDLLNYVRKRRKLKEEVAKYIFKQVVEGLIYCHTKGIVHRDMKLDNILLDEQGVVKICDFGVSKLLSSTTEKMTEQCGTPAYIAPEILKDKGYRGFGVDIWSLGVCLYAMLYGTVPFKANNMSELHQLIQKAKYTMKDDTKPGEAPLSEEVKSLVKLLLEPNPDKRIGIQAVRQHQWLQEEVKIELFTEQEIQTIKKDFTYQDMSRYKRNQRHKTKLDTHKDDNGVCITTEEPLFTEHALDSTQNALMKNCTTKSVVLAPFNSTRTHILKEEVDQDVPQDDETDSIPPLVFDRNMLVDKKVIKYAPRVKDINRQYEMNNNCELDNGVYNKFLKCSQEDQDISDDEGDNSLVTSMNKEENQYGNYVAPLVSQNSDEEAEADLIKKNQDQNKSELKQFQTFLQKENTKFNQIPEDQLLIGIFNHINIYLQIMKQQKELKYMVTLGSLLLTAWKTLR